MPEHPQVGKYVREISSRVRYPIENFGQLMKALGGHDAVIEFEGWRGAAGRLKEFIPDHYFPVVSEEDLRRKSEELRTRYQQSRESEGAAGEADLDASPARKKDVTRVKLPKSDAHAGVAKFEEG